MGKCQSCCETPGSTSDPTNSQRSGNSAMWDYSRTSQQLHQRNARKDMPEGDIIGQLSSIQQHPLSSTDKKMFTPYPKLPPIKRHTNSDSKRLSFISKDYSESKIQVLFEKYKDPVEEVMLAEGIENFCIDLDVKPDEFIVLVLAWKFQAETMCRFTKEEFVNGCKALKVDSVKGIQSKFQELLAEVINKENFKDLYRWTYKFGLELGQRTLPIDMTISLWKLVYSQNKPAILLRWLDFLTEHPTIRGIPRDTWDMFLNFAEQVGDDLGSYDDTEAWPSLFDDFVEYENDRQNQNVNKSM